VTQLTPARWRRRRERQRLRPIMYRAGMAALGPADPMCGVDSVLNVGSSLRSRSAHFELDDNHVGDVVLDFDDAWFVDGDFHLGVAGAVFEFLLRRRVHMEFASPVGVDLDGDGAPTLASTRSPLGVTLSPRTFTSRTVPWFAEAAAPPRGRLVPRKADTAAALSPEPSSGSPLVASPAAETGVSCPQRCGPYPGPIAVQGSERRDCGHRWWRPRGSAARVG
jgi:hypothetical protein